MPRAVLVVPGCRPGTSPLTTNSSRLMLQRQSCGMIPQSALLLGSGGNGKTGVGLRVVPECGWCGGDRGVVTWLPVTGDAGGSVWGKVGWQEVHAQTHSQQIDMFTLATALLLSSFLSAALRMLLCLVRCQVVQRGLLPTAPRGVKFAHKRRFQLLPLGPVLCGTSPRDDNVFEQFFRF